MKAAIFHKPGHLQLEEVKMPEIKEDELLIKVKACGICGTDRHIFKGEAPAANNIALGHELAGIVEKFGTKVTGFKPGDRVVVDPNIFCGECFYCRQGEVNLCENLKAVGVTQNGGFAEYVAVPAGNVYLLPESLSFEEGAMVEPVSCCLRGIDRANIRPGDYVLVLGGGAIGLILAQLARAAGAAEVFISEPKEYNRQLAKNLGFNHVYGPNIIKEKIAEKTQQGVDLVIEAVGSKVTTQESFRLIRKGGTIVIFGVAPEEETVDIYPFDIYKRELTIKGSYVNPFVSERAIKLLAAGKVNVKPLITDKHSLEKLPELLAEVPSKDSIKSMIVFE